MESTTGAVVRITTDNEVSIMEIPWTLQGFYDAIGDGCDCFETVRTDISDELFRRLADAPLLMLVDESGQIKGKPANSVASRLYGYGINHFCPIVGNAVFVHVGRDDFFPLKHPEELMDFLQDLFPELYREEVIV